MNQKPLIQLQHIALFLEARQVLTGVSLSLYPAEIVTLLGRSGVGKTSLLRLIAGLSRPSAGQILRWGIRSFADIGYLMQEEALLPWRSVLSNVALAAELGPSCRLSQREIRSRAYASVCEVGLKGYEEASITELSAGMRQRVALARTLFLPKRLVLLDEPFHALDVHTREELYALIKALRKTRDTAFFMVTHDMRDALLLADRVCVLAKGKISWDSPASKLSGGPACAKLKQAML